MKRLPVKLLIELISPDEIITAYHVKETHAVKFCPVGISLPDESRVSLQCYCGEEHFSELRYTPRASTTFRQRISADKKRGCDINFLTDDPEIVEELPKVCPEYGAELTREKIPVRIVYRS